MSGRYDLVQYSSWPLTGLTMTKTYTMIAAGYAQINQIVDDKFQHAFDNFKQLEQKIIEQEIEITTLTIDPLSTDWHSELKPNHFRSGCAPIQAIYKAKELISQGQHAVVISGEEPLKSGYDRGQRHKLMAIYNDKKSIADLYNDLAHQFIDHHDSSKEEFLALADHLFQNHTRSHKLAVKENRAYFESPEPKWFHHVTDLFRGVDCANPLVDFTGKLLLCSDSLAKKLGLNNLVKVAGVGVGSLDVDELKSIAKISRYEHLTQAYEIACAEANIDFNQLVHNKQALMKVYTCYPVVPMAFLLNTGLVENLAQIPDFLSEHLLTLNGGMNLARAPWNNPALYGLIEMYHQLLSSQQKFGLVHGNGGLGYRQGVAILSAGPAKKTGNIGV